MEILPFPTRTDAGHQLSEQLQAYKGQPDTLILSLVRGGIVIGAALAEDLKLPLYPYIVRKLGHPTHREYALGAIAEGGEMYMDTDWMQAQGISPEDMQPIIDKESAELERRKKVYTVKPRPSLKGKTVIITDDGAATGATMFAAIADIRAQDVASIIVALPVSASDTAQKLKEQVDETVILATPEPFNAVGLWYQHFSQVEDDEVLEILKKDL